MTSAIDATKPVTGAPTTQSVRDNFATAKNEITALQSPTQIIVNLNSVLPAVPPGVVNVPIRVIGPNGSNYHNVFDSFTGAGAIGGGTLLFRNSGGTAAAPSATVNGNAIGALAWWGYGATGYVTGARARLQSIASQQWTDTAQGTILTIETTPPNTNAMVVGATFARGLTLGPPIGGGADLGPGSLIVNMNAQIPALGFLSGPNIGLLIEGPDGGPVNPTILTHGGTPNLQFFRLNGTSAAVSQVVAGNILGRHRFGGYTSSGSLATDGVDIVAVATEPWTATANGAQLQVATTPVGTLGATNTVVATFGSGLTLGTPPAVGTDTPRGSLIANMNTAPPVTGLLTSAPLLLQGADGAGCTANVLGINGNPVFAAHRANGTAGALAAVGNASFLARVTGNGFDGAAWGQAVAVNLNTTENWTATAHGANFTINTTPNGTLVSTQGALTLDGLGNLTIAGATATKPGGGAWVAPSDPALKSDVTPYTDGLDVLLQLQPVRYAYNGRAGTPDDGRQYVGLDAEATAAAMPSLVGEMSYQPHAPNDEGELVPEGALETYKTVDPSELVFTLINAVRELTARVAQLEGAAPAR